MLLKAAALGREEFIKLPLGHASIDVNLQKKVTSRFKVNYSSISIYQ